MKDMEKLLKIDLGLFDGAAAGTGGEGAPQSEAPAGKGDAAQAGKLPGNGRRAKTGEKTVVYGKQPDAPKDGQAATAPGKEKDAVVGLELTEGAGAQDTNPDPETRRAKFDELVRGEFKDLYDERVQGIVKARLGEKGQLESRLEAVSPVLDLLAQKYGVDAGDPAAILQAVEKDDAYWEQAAEDAGMTVEQYKAMTKLERENAQLRRAQELTQQQQAVNRQVAQWEEQGETLKASYPGFDLHGECRNPQFVSLLQNGVDVKTAYEVLHMDEIKNGVAAGAAKAAERNVTETIKAKGMRPAENGAAGQGGVIVKDDVSKLSKADRAEIIRRVARGERITF